MKINYIIIYILLANSTFAQDNLTKMVNTKKIGLKKTNDILNSEGVTYDTYLSKESDFDVYILLDGSVLLRLDDNEGARIYKSREDLLKVLDIEIQEADVLGDVVFRQDDFDLNSTYYPNLISDSLKIDTLDFSLSSLKIIESKLNQIKVELSPEIIAGVIYYVQAVYVKKYDKSWIFKFDFNSDKKIPFIDGANYNGILSKEIAIELVNEHPINLTHFLP